MTLYLLVAIMFTTTPSGVSSTMITHDLPSYASCKAAGEALKRMGGTRVKYECVTVTDDRYDQSDEITSD